MKISYFTQMVPYVSNSYTLTLVVLLGGLALTSCQRFGQFSNSDKSQTSEVNSNLKVSAVQEQTLPEFPCLNKNMFFRLIKTGTVECKHSATIDFSDPHTQKPYMGALFKMFLDVYLSIPVYKFISLASSKIKSVELDTQTVFINLQLADDPENKRPMVAIVKARPEIVYTFKEICSVRLHDLKVRIEEVKSPDLGPLADRIPGIVNGMILLYKDEAIKAIQAQIDTLEQNKFCWYYRKAFHRGEIPTAYKVTEPPSEEKAEAEKILSGESKNPEATKSEIEIYNQEKYQEFEKKMDCKWWGGC